MEYSITLTYNRWTATIDAEAISNVRKDVTANNGNKIPAIRALMRAYALPLTDAKRLVEAIMVMEKLNTNTVSGLTHG